MGRQFFVGGNFKMCVSYIPFNLSQTFQLLTVLIRNGTKKTIADIIQQLNDASLDPNTGRL